MSEKPQRIDKLLSHVGFGSRKDIRALVKAGRVLVNGDVVRDPGRHVVPDVDDITVDGETVVYRAFVYLMMNKPPGVVSATEDLRDRTVTDLLEPHWQAFEPFPVGRLDKDTEGLLLLTNDGQLAHRLLSPRRHVPKRYYAEVAGEVTRADVEAFRAGLELDDGYRTLPSELSIQSMGQHACVEVTLYEGKYHQVKRMFEAVGKRVVYLKRLSMGSLTLDPLLPVGAVRELTDDELVRLRTDAGLEV
ncbi:MAG: rRNA pseudouridine synthase [Alicyclobacillus sp.]|nr:rRNA pseudouridine synthase [Alicyclobacillus sp.]